MDPAIQALPPLIDPTRAPEWQFVDPAQNAERPREAEPAKEAVAHEEGQDRSEVPLERRLEQINRLTKHLSFSYHKPTDRVQIRVADGSGKLVREIPSDEFLRTMEKLHGNAGAILDDKA